MSFNPARKIQDVLAFGEFGGVNPSVPDSATFTFLSPNTMTEVFDHEIEGCFLYSRHFNPINKYLSQVLAAMEGTESANVTASGMGAITCAILQLCKQGDEIVSSRTIYGGTWAFFKNFLPRLGITVKFIDVNDREALEAAVTDKTRVIYTETMSNPLLQVADLPMLSEFAHARDIRLVVDNTFTPMMVTPSQHGADVVVYSMTKFINGTNDTVAGAICGSKPFIASTLDVHAGACMLLGPTLDSFRAASIQKNIHTLHIRMKQHSRNAKLLAEAVRSWELKVHYPGFEDHPTHGLMKKMMNPEYGFGGMIALDVGDKETANKVLEAMQEEKVGYLAVSLGYFKTLFSAPGQSTSSEIPEDEQKEMGLTGGLIRFSMGLDDDMDETIARVRRSLERCGVLK